MKQDINIEQHRCNCDSCKRGRKFKTMLENVTGDDAKHFFNQLYKILCDVEYELEMLQYTMEKENG